VQQQVSVLGAVRVVAGPGDLGERAGGEVEFVDEDPVGVVGLVHDEPGAVPGARHGRVHVHVEPGLVGDLDRLVVGLVRGRVVDVGFSPAMSRSRTRTVG
jgi:hypothetical protein